jgi:hypothetical protein
MYAARLEEVAKHVESLGDDDPMLQRLAALPKAVRAWFGFGGGTMHTQTIHCNYDFRLPGGGILGIPRWLESWVNEAIKAAQERAAEWSK